MSRLRQPAAPLRWLIQMLVWLVAFSMIAPFLWMILTSLKSDSEATRSPTLATLLPETFRWDNYARAFREAQLGRFYFNSILVGVITTVLAVAHNALAGYAFAKLRFAGTRILFGLVLATMMLPATVSFVFAYLICQRLGYVNNYQSLIVPFLASGFGVFYMRQVITSIPDSLLESARIDGMGHFEVFWTIVRPLAWPGLVALSIFSFVNSWNAFFWPLIVVDSPRYKTLPLAISDLSAGLYVQSWPVQTAAATILVLPPMIVFFLTQRAFVRSVMFSGLKDA